MSDENRFNEYFSNSPSPEKVNAEYVGRVSADSATSQNFNNPPYNQPPFNGGAYTQNNGYNYNNGNAQGYSQTPPEGYRNPPQYQNPQKAAATPPTKPPKEKIKAEMSDIFAFIITLVTVFTSASAVFADNNGIITGAIQLVFLGFATIMIAKKNKTTAKNAVFPGIIAFTTAISNFLTPEMSFLKLVFSYYIFNLYCMSLTDTKGYPMNSLTNIFHQVRAMLLIPTRKMLLPVASLFRNMKLLPIGQLIGIGTGVFLGIPFLIITAFLLVNADMAFSGFVSDVFYTVTGYLAGIFSVANIAVIITTIAITPLLYSFLFSSKYGVIKQTLGDNKSEAAVIKLGFVHSSVLLGFYGVISICYITYIFSQFRYLFSGFEGMVANGTSYSVSQYARQGFFEMSGVAALNLILISLGSVFAKRKDKTKLPKTYKGFSIFFCLFTLLIISTAVSKMVLYVTELGFTEKRILVLLADIILFVAFLAILIRLFVKKFPYLRIISSFALAVLFIYCMFGSDSLIGSFNTGMYLSDKHEKFHTETLAAVSDDYVKIINFDKLVNDGYESVAITAKDKIYHIYLEHTTDGYRALNVSDILCDSYIEKNKERFEAYKEFCYELSEDKDVYASVKYDYDFISSTFSLIVEVPERYTSFEVSNDLLSTVCSKDNGSAFMINDEIFIFDWLYPEDTTVIATVKATDIDGNVYTFTVERSDINSTDEASNIVYTSNGLKFEGVVAYKDGDMLIYQ